MQGERLLEEVVGPKQKNKFWAPARLAVRAVNLQKRSFRKGKCEKVEGGNISLRPKKAEKANRGKRLFSKRVSFSKGTEVLEHDDTGNHSEITKDGDSV